MPEKDDITQEQKSVFRNWTTEDVKLFIITITATIAANVITVITVAVAVILARFSRPRPATPANYALLFGVEMVPLIGYWALLYSFFHFKGNEMLGPVSKARRWVYLIVGALFVIGTLIFVLIWIGFAAGIK